jgi:hypothetical protein
MNWPSSFSHHERFCSWVPWKLKLCHIFPLPNIFTNLRNVFCFLLTYCPVHHFVYCSRNSTCQEHEYVPHPNPPTSWHRGKKDLDKGKEGSCFSCQRYRVDWSQFQRQSKVYASFAYFVFFVQSALSVFATVIQSYRRTRRNMSCFTMRANALIFTFDKPSVCSSHMYDKSIRVKEKAS